MYSFNIKYDIFNHSCSNYIGLCYEDGTSAFLRLEILIKLNICWIYEDLLVGRVRQVLELKLSLDGLQIT